jgi:hypothetical protein
MRLMYPTLLGVAKRLISDSTWPSKTSGCERMMRPIHTARKNKSARTAESSGARTDGQPLLIDGLPSRRRFNEGDRSTAANREEN